MIIIRLKANKLVLSLTITYPWVVPSREKSSSSNRFCRDICVFREVLLLLTLVRMAVLFPSSRMLLMLLLSWPRSATRWTSLLWARTSAENALCSCGERRDRCESREFMFRRIGWDRVAVEGVVFFWLPPSDSGDILATYDFINEIRDSSVRIAFSRVLRLAITARVYHISD